MKNQLLLEKLMKNYLVILDENAKEGIETRAIKGGFIFDKVLSDDNIEIIESINKNKIDKLTTLFSEDDTLLDKVVKTIIEYTLFGIPKGEGFHTVNAVVENVRMVKVLNLKEYQEFCNDLVRMDKALDSSIIPQLLDYLTLPLEEVKNKEVKILYMEKLIENGKFVNGYELIRYINYLLTENTLFINFKKEYANKKYDFNENPEVIRKVISILEKYTDELSKYVNTYKDFFIHIKLWAKRNDIDKLPRLLNRVVRRAKKTKQANLSIKFHKEILDKSLEEQEKFFKELSIKELFKFINYLKLENFYATTGKKDYRIRNGKFFIREYKGEVKESSTYVPKRVLREKLIEKFTEIETVTFEDGSTFEKPTFVPPVFPKDWTTPLLMSDKQRSNGVFFKGSFELKKSDKIGVIWTTDSDLDLSVKDTKGNTFSWNHRWGNEDNPVTYSGDMREPSDETGEGVEYFKVNDVDTFEGYFRLNRYSSRDLKPAFTVFVERNNEIVYKSEEFKFCDLGKFQVTIGYILEGKFYLDVFPERNSSVAYIRDELDKSIKKDEISIVDFLLRKPVYTIEEVLDEVGIKYEKLASNELGDKKYTIFE